MSYVSQKSHPNRTKRWMIRIGIFIVIQTIFMVIDGTFLEPKLNDSNNVFTEMLKGILQSRLLNEWVAPYSFPLFNLVLIVHAAALLLQAASEMISAVLKKR